jgi:2-methylcitrate dehydratase PrpD
MLDPLLQVDDQSNAVSPVVALADYAAAHAIKSDTAFAAARHCLIEALARGFEALRDPRCAALMGPLVPGALMPGGARVPGTSLELDPAQAAFCTSLMLCRTASGSHWEALQSKRAADPIAAILAVADYRARKAMMEGKPPPKVRDVLGAIIKALEIQGVLMGSARIAATVIVTAQLGGALRQIVIALSFAGIDAGMPLGAAESQHDIQREDWARANAMSHAVRCACQAMAANPSSHPASLGLAADPAAEFLGATSAARRKPFGTEVIGRLARLRTPQDAIELTMRFQTAVERHFPPRQAERIKALFAYPDRLDDLPVNELIAALVTNGSR